MKTLSTIRPIVAVVLLFALLLAAVVAFSQTPVQEQNMVNSGNSDNEYGFTNSLKTFNVSVYEDVAYIKWTVKGEQQECIYAIERSADGSNFTTIAYKDGVPVQNKDLELMYSTRDAAPLDKISYYRLKQVKPDGVIYSHAVSVFNNPEENFASKNK